MSSAAILPDLPDSKLVIVHFNNAAQKDVARRFLTYLRHELRNVGYSMPTPDRFCLDRRYLEPGKNLVEQFFAAKSITGVSIEYERVTLMGDLPVTERRTVLNGKPRSA